MLKIRRLQDPLWEDSNSKGPDMGRTMRKWFFRGAIMFLVGMLLLLALPSMLGSRWIYKPLLDSLSENKFVLQVESVKLRWFSPLELRGIVVSDLPSPSEVASQPPTPLLAIHSIRTNRGLLSYLLHGRDLGKVEVVRPSIDISLLQNQSNLQRLLESLQTAQQKIAPKKEIESEKGAPKLDIDLQITQASVQVTRLGESKPIAVVPPFDIKASYRASQNDPSITVEPTTILDRVELTQELIGLGLGHAVPVLAKSAWFDGSVSLAVGQIVVPLESPVDSKGQATLTLHRVRTGPSEPMVVDAIEFLSRLRNQPATLELVFVEDSPIKIVVEGTRIHHSGLEAGLPKLDERLQFSSSGSVGLSDKSLDIVLVVPVPVEQLAQRESVQQLGVPKIRIPIQGTLDEPQLEPSLLRKDSGLILGMIAGQIEKDSPLAGSVLETLGEIAEGDADQAISSAVDIFQAIRERRKKQSESTNEADPDSDTKSDEKSEPSRRPFLDALKKALRP